MNNWTELFKSLKKDADPDAENNIVSTVSQPFEPPQEGNNIAVKIITNTGAEMGATVTVTSFRHGNLNENKPDVN